MRVQGTKGDNNNRCHGDRDGGSGGDGDSDGGSDGDGDSDGLSRKCRRHVGDMSS